MADVFNNISDEKKEEILTFLSTRFTELEALRTSLDDEIEKEIDLYNDKDENIQNKESYESQITTPYLYTVVQTIVARLISAVFGDKNFIRIFVEEEKYLNIEKKLQAWAQKIVDKMKVRKRARDIFENALVKRVSWLQLKPKKVNNRFRPDFMVHDFFNVWFDTKAKDVNDTDFFIRTEDKLWQVLAQEEKLYHNTSLVANTNPPDFNIEREEYTARHSSDDEENVSYYEIQGNNITGKVELLEWHGEYDMSDNPDEPDFRTVIFTLANREVLIRVETVDLPTIRKRLIFPIRPLKQADSLIGKSVPQLLGSLQKELNEIKSLRLDNFKNLIKLIFKYNANADIPLDTLFAKGSNAIPWTDDPNDVTTLDQPNLVQIATLMMQSEIQEMQQTVGATDHVMGTSAARGIADTATGTQKIIEQAMFKFSMMAENTHDDFSDFFNYAMMLHMIDDKKDTLFENPEFKDYFELPIEVIEDTDFIDIYIKDLAQRRDIERAQFVNAAGMILPILQQTGGNIGLFLKQVMERFDMQQIEAILESPPQEKQMMQMIMQMMRDNPQFAQFIQQVLQNPDILKQMSGGTGQTKEVTRATRPEEEGLNPIPEGI